MGIKVLNWLSREATAKRTFLLFVSVLFFLICVSTQFFGLIHLDVKAILDSSDFYNSEAFYHAIEIQGESGRQAYLIFHLFDYALMFSLTLFFMFLMYPTFPCEL